MLKIGQKRGIKKKLNPRLSLSRRQQIRASDTRVLSKFMGFTLSVFGVFCTSNSLTLNQIAYPPQFLLQELLQNVETSENLEQFVDELKRLFFRFSRSPAQVSFRASYIMHQMSRGEKTPDRFQKHRKSLIMITGYPKYYSDWTFAVTTNPCKGWTPRFLWVLSIMPKIPEIQVGIQIERFVSVSSDRNIRDHLWRWSTHFGRGIFRPKFAVPFLTNWFFALNGRKFGKRI